MDKNAEKENEHGVFERTRGIEITICTHCISKWKQREPEIIGQLNESKLEN